MPLLSDEVTVALLELYARRRDISRNEALRRLVRTGLGVDPIGFWQDKRRRKKSPSDVITAARKIKPQRTPKQHVPSAHAEMFQELKKKIGASEARRLVVEHAALIARRA